MKKLITFIFAIIAIAACTEKEVAVTSVSVSPATLELTAGDAAVSLSAKVLPDNAIASVSWTSSDNSVASVSSNGAVSPLKEGSATITATAGGKSGTCKVTVKAKTVAVTGVSLDKTELTLTEGDDATLTATIAPDNATNKNVSWKSSDVAIASVDNAGKVTAVKAGEATITVTTEDGNKTTTCKVSVKAKTVAVTGVSLDKSELTLTEGENATLKATIAPDNATNKNVSWKSSDAAIASVDNAGKVTAVKAGEATITVTTEDGNKTATCKVTVNAKVIVATGITVSPENLTMTEGETYTLSATIIPAEATDKEIEWASNNTSVATVDNATGEVTAIKEGVASIIARCVANHSIQASCNLTVNRDYSLKGISFTASEVQLTVGKTQQIGVNFYPDYAANKNLTWSSSNNTIATVSSEGMVKGVAEGTATITAVSEDGGHKATCVVEVSKRTQADIYCIVDGQVCVNGVKTDIEAILVAVEGNEYYTIRGYGSKKLYKGENEIASFNSYDAIKLIVKNGTSYYLNGSYNYNKATVSMVTPDGEITNYDLNNGSGNMMVTDFQVDKIGDIYVVGWMQDPYTTDFKRDIMQWKITTDGKITPTVIMENNYALQPRIALDNNGNVYTLFYVEKDQKLKLFKNGLEHSVISDCYKNSIYASLAVHGNDVYVAASEPTDDGKYNTKCWKNGTPLYTYGTDAIMDVTGMSISSNGDIYVAMYTSADNVSYIYKNDTQLYRMEYRSHTVNSLAVME